MASAAEVFQIEIQQRMSGDALTPLRELEGGIHEAKAAYMELAKAQSTAERAVEKNSAALKAAKEAQAAAEAAGDTGAAEKAAAQVAKLAAKDEELRGKATAAAQAVEKQAGALDKLADEYKQLKSAEDAQRKAAEHSAQSLERKIKMGDGLEKLGGPLGFVGAKAKGMFEAFKDLKEGGMSSMGAMATMGAAGFATLAASVAAAGAALGALSLYMLDAKRDTDLTLEAMFQSPETASAMSSAFGEVATSTGIARDRLLDLTRDLKAAKVSTEDMPAALKAIAQQEMALGDSSGTGELIKSLESGKKTVAELGAEMDTQFGAVAAKKAMGLTHVVDRLKERFLSLLDGVNIEGILQGFDVLVGLLDASSESGQTLKMLMGDMFGPLGDGLGVFYTIERFILGMELGFLDVAIAVKKTARALGFDLGSLEDFPDVATVAQVAGAALAVSVAAVGAAFLATYYVVSVTVGAINSVASAIGKASESIPKSLEGLKGAVAKVLEGVSSVGSDLVAGIAKGITDNAAKVLEAITGVVNGAIEGAKALLKIESPSKVFAEIGGFTSEGFAEGIDAKAPMAEKAMRTLVETPAVVVPMPEVREPAPAPQGAPSLSVVINVEGGGEAQATADAIEERLTEVLERWARMGAAA